MNDTHSEPSDERTQPNALITDFVDDYEKQVVAYAYEVAKYSVFEDSPNRQITDWKQYVNREKPSETDWKQKEGIEHRIRNITPLVRGGNDVSTDNAVAFEYTTKNVLTGDISTRVETHDPRGIDSVIRWTPLVPQDYTQYE